MGMPKFFFDKIDMTQGQICLHGEDEKHIKTVLRAKEGEELTLCDGEGMDYQCRISSLTDGDSLQSALRNRAENKNYALSGTAKGG